MSNTFPHNGEDSQLAREGSRQQRAEARAKSGYRRHDLPLHDYAAYCSSRRL